MSRTIAIPRRGPGFFYSANPFLAGGFDIFLDPSHLATMYVERTGSPPSTKASVDGVVGSILNLGSAGGYFRATADANRPTLRQSGSLYYLEFDGTNDFLQLDISFTGSLLYGIAAFRPTATSNNCRLWCATTTALANDQTSDARASIIARHGAAATWGGTQTFANYGGKSVSNDSDYCLESCFTGSGHYSNLNGDTDSTSSFTPSSAFSVSRIRLGTWDPDSGNPVFKGRFYGGGITDSDPASIRSPCRKWLGSRAGLIIT